jgi:hypothetical protein
MKVHSLIVAAVAAVAFGASFASADYSLYVTKVDTSVAGNVSVPFSVLQLPLVGANPNAPLATISIPGVVLSSTYDNDRQLKLSTDAGRVTLTGYKSAPGTANPFTSSTSTSPRTIVSIATADNTVSSVNLNTTYYNGLLITSAVYSAEKNAYYVAGENTKSSPSKVGGPRYFTADGQTSYNLYTPPDDTTGTASVRSVGIFGGQLFYSSGSSSFGAVKGISALGSGVTVPTADTKLVKQTYNLYPTGTTNVINGGVDESTTDFTFVDSNNNGIYDIGYRVRNGGLQKLVLDEPTNVWYDYGTLGSTNLKAVAAVTLDNKSYVYATDATHLYFVPDNDTANGFFSGSLSSYTVYTAPAGTQLGGVVIVPEPAALGLLAPAAMTLVSRRRRA